METTGINHIVKVTLQRKVRDSGRELHRQRGKKDSWDKTEITSLIYSKNQSCIFKLEILIALLGTRTHNVNFTAVCFLN